MASTLAARVRLTTRHSAVWRSCAGCTGLAPLAPDATHCRACLAEQRTSRRRPRRAA
jgi:hypothetical protein